MSEHFNKLTPAEAERLAILAEECGEVIQAVGKILRHGYESKHPADTTAPNNRGALERELGDVQAIIAMMKSFKDVSRVEIAVAESTKKIKVVRYMHHHEEATV
jgi:NTP pyrophosphatase (non-canonical NTP hydrolase)